MKKLITICLAATVILVLSGAAQATLSWQTTPILGTDASNATGDVVVITGPQPLDAYGNPYYDVDNNPVLGPTIPHYSIAGDPLFGIGSPSMTVFAINPDQFIDGHWTDTVAKIANGSGINVDTGTAYHWSSVFTYLGTLQPQYSIISEGDYNATSSFVMLYDTGLTNLWAEDIGKWQYTEIWTVLGTKELISYSTEFQVVPEPATLCILGFGALSLVIRKK